MEKRANYFWEKGENQRQFLESLKKEYNIKSPEDWYAIKVPTYPQSPLKVSDVRKKEGGYSFLEKYGGSLQRALTHFYPGTSRNFFNHFVEVDWKPWLFNSVPPLFWTKRENQLNFMNWLGKKLGIVKLEDWYGVQV